MAGTSRSLLVVAAFLLVPSLFAADRPNVVMIVTDDQGFGDLGCNGNPRVRTPNIDRFAKQSIRLTNFHVCPVCSPTRASLMTGRYNYRTGVVDTYLGRSLMHADETTLAELLRDAGYRTGIFGKWHLGDNYPLRAIDQGFQEALVGKGGGLTQPSDPPGTSYFDPILMHNGKAEKIKGYCSDIFAEAARKFVAQESDKPFFLYLPFNAPHDPLQVDDKLVEPYRQMNLSPDQFPRAGFPVKSFAPKEQIARTYAMVENIDTNLGKLFALLDERKLADNTIVIFVTDNGPARARYNGGLRGLKGSVFDGGIRVPCFIRWPRQFQGGEMNLPAAHIDILPTLLHCCGVKKPDALELDGRDLFDPLSSKSAGWKDRSLFFQWHRCDAPEKFRAFAVRGPRFKLVQPFGVGDQPQRDKWDFLLFDMQNDPYEQKNIAKQHEEIVRAMKQEYSDWFDDVGRPRGYAPPRIYLGAAAENPVVLTRQDWRGPRAGWRPDDLGHWEVHVEREGTYNVTVRLSARPEAGTVTLKLGEVRRDGKLPAQATEVVFRGLKLSPGDVKLEASLRIGERDVGANYVEVERVEEK
jgi:arylsulfatase A-like enzyme